MALNEFGGESGKDQMESEHEKVVKAMVETMQGIAEANKWSITPQQLRTAAILLMDKAEEEEGSIELNEAR